MTDALPEGWTVDEQSEEEKLDSKLPEGWKVEEEEEKRNPFHDVVSEELRAQGYEPDASEEFERAAELGQAEAMRGFLSGRTFGLTENIPGLETSDTFAGYAGKFAGSVAPLSKMIKFLEPQAMKLAAKSPVFQKQIGSLLTMFGVGSANTALESVAKGEMPSADEVLEHGFQWAAIDAGLNLLGMTGKFAGFLFNKAKNLAVPRKQVVSGVIEELVEAGVDMTKPEKVAQAALEIIEKPITEAEAQAGQARKLQLAKQAETEASKVAKEALAPKPITGTDLKEKVIEESIVNKQLGESINLAEPIQPEKINLIREGENLNKGYIEKKISYIAPRAASKEQLGKTITQDIEANLEAAKAEYKPLYDVAQEAAEKINHTAQEAALAATEKLAVMSRLKTKPAGYPSVLNNLETILEDLGFQVKKSAKGIQVTPKKPVPLKNSIELAKRINEMVDYQAIEPSVKDALKKVNKALKSDIRIAFEQNSEGLAAFEMAEAEHGRVAGLYGRDSIRTIRGQQAGEKVARMAESPSTLSDLKEVLTPKQIQVVERELLENLNEQTFERAQKSFREMEQHLSKENKKLAKEIVESKNPHNPAVRKKVTQEAVLDEVGQAFTNGTRPKKTLELWQNPKGQKLVEQAFEGSPNWPKVKQYLEKQSFNDLVETVISKGKLDLHKFDKLMENPAVMNNIRAQGGEEAVRFFQGLSNKVEKFRGNIKLLEKLPPKEQIDKGRKFFKDSPGQRRLEKGIAEKERVKRTTQEIAKDKVHAKGKPGEAARIEKESSGLRGQEILERMARKDYPQQAKLNDWHKWLKESLGLNAQAAMNVFGAAKLGAAVFGSYAVGIPTTAATILSYKVMNKMLTSQHVRRSFIEAAKHKTNTFEFILALQKFDEAMEEEED